MLPRRTRSLLSSLLAVGLGASVALVVPAPAVAEESDRLTPRGGVPQATISRTSYGIPHIVADDYTSLGFGTGFAVAEDAVCSLADTFLTGRGQRSRYFGPDERYDDQVTFDATNLQADTLFTNLRDRKVVEALLDDDLRGPGRETRAMVDGYVAGYNRYLASTGGSAGVTDPACKDAEWVRPVEPLDLYYAIYAANLLASAGVFVPQITEAAPPTPDPGLPIGGTNTGFAPVPEVVPSEQSLKKGLGKDPNSPFGSNGTALGGDTTATGRGMVLGNPHFPWRGRYRFTQAQLTIPGAYDVAGAMLIGSPVVNIGWNRDVAWTHTVSTGFRFTPYEYRTVPGSPTTYVTEQGPKRLQRDEMTVVVRRDDGVLEDVVTDVYRTDEGFVLDAPEILLGWTPASFFALREANAEHLKTLDAFHEMSKATSAAELVAAGDRTGGIPFVNTLTADRDGEAIYADNAVVPNVPDELVQRCATPVGRVLFQLAGLPALDGTRASGECAWRDDSDAARPGIFGPANQPDTTRRDWVVNANDSFWLPNPAEPLEGFARIIGCERCERSLRTRMVYRYVLDRLDGSDGLGGPDLFTHEQLKAVQYENRVFAAEVAREGDDLQDVCTAAAGGSACDVLAGWDGRSDLDSVGTHVFREFWLRTAPRDRFEVPFDPDQPVTTPRDLDEGNDRIVAAMRQALAFLSEKGVAFDAPLRDLQVAGDDGAPPIPVGGGAFDTGNANAVVPRTPASNLDALYPISYGSSHIQAVAFTDEGVDASTILTYGLAIDPTRRSSTDQTELFSQERWVDFPFTAQEIAADPELRTYVVTGARTAAAPPAEAPAAVVRGSRALAATGGTPVLWGLATLGALAVVVRRRSGSRSAG